MQSMYVLTCGDSYRIERVAGLVTPPPWVLKNSPVSCADNQI